MLCKSRYPSRKKTGVHFRSESAGQELEETWPEEDINVVR